MPELVAEIQFYMEKLFPICRSITGEGNRKTLQILQKIVPIKIGEYSSGTKVYDWIIPKEWNIRDAWIKNASGEKIIDFRRSNLHVLNYSIPVSRKIRGEDLQSHLHFLRDMPEAIPYRTSYYKDNWGFCLSWNDYQKYIKEEEEYEVLIDAEHKPGSMTYGELLIPGSSSKEYLITTYICHPSLANENLSGPVMTAFLARELLRRKLKYSYRIIFIPETIGAVAYCAQNEEAIKKIEAGIVITCVGGPGLLGYKQSFDRTHYINSLAERALHSMSDEFKTYPFDIHGSDERQFSSPGFRLNMISITKDKYYEYPQYHTSLDDLDFVKGEYIYKTLQAYLLLIQKIEDRIIYRRVEPHGEVMLSRHGLYPSNGGAQNPMKDKKAGVDSLLQVLFFMDGIKSIDEIAREASIDMDTAHELADKLAERGIIEQI
jgi:aminopeptidase-like protein